MEPRPKRPIQVSASALLMLAFLVGCAPASSLRPASKTAESAPAFFSHGELPFWRLDELAGTAKAQVLLNGPSGSTLLIDSARLRLVHGVALRIVAAAGPGESPTWLLLGSSSINAFATFDRQQPVIAITLGMLALLDEDQGAWGALLGHELAHLRLGHHHARRARSEALELGSSLAGLLLSAVGLSLGSVAADATGKLVECSFSRDDERQADRTGIAYVRAAGLDPQGALRLQQRLLLVNREAAFTFLSTHPSGTERVAAIRLLLEAEAGSGGD